MPKKSDNSPDAPTLKEQMEALATIVEKLEDPDIDLEESLALYERGIALVPLRARYWKPRNSGLRW